MNRGCETLLAVSITSLLLINRPEVDEDLAKAVKYFLR
jgi:hypothetical protein